MSELPLGTVTFLFTDVEGSTKLLDALGSVSYHEVLTTHQRLLREVFAAHGGREIDTHGDSFFVAFQRAAEAVQAAIEGQVALAGHGWPPGVRVRVRIGIDTGEPTIGGDRYVGLGVHRSARIMAAGHGGQILVSGTTRDLIIDELPAGTSLLDLGLKRLKDIERPVHLFQVVASGLETKFAPIKTFDSGPRRKASVLIAGGILALGAAIVFAVLFLGGGGSPIVVEPNSVGVIDLGRNKVVARIPVGDTPTAVAVGAGGVWALNANAQTVDEIDPVKRTVERTIGVGASPNDLAVGRGVVWVSSGTRTITEIDPSAGVTGRTFTFATRPVLGSDLTASSVAADSRAVWATSSATAARIAPGLPRSFIVLDFGCCNGAALDGSSVWVTTDQGVDELNAETGKIETRIALGFGCQAVAVGYGATWVTDQYSNTLWRIVPSTGQAPQSITVGANPAGVAIGAGSVWVANGDGTVTRVEPTSGLVTASIPVGGTPQGIAVGYGAAWVTVD